LGNFRESASGREELRKGPRHLGLLLFGQYFSSPDTTLSCPCCRAAENFSEGRRSAGKKDRNPSSRGIKKKRLGGNKILAKSRYLNRVEGQKKTSGTKVSGEKKGLIKCCGSGAHLEASGPKKRGDKQEEKNQGLWIGAWGRGDIKERR